MKNIEKVQQFFRSGLKSGKQSLAALVKLADHEFNSQVTQDEATGKWKVTKQVEETSLFDSEEEAIQWSTEPIGKRPPGETVQSEQQERTPLMEPISTDENTVDSNTSVAPDTQFQESGGPEHSETPPSAPENYQEASSFMPEASSDSDQRFGIKESLVQLEAIAKNLRKAGKEDLASKINKIKEEHYSELSGPIANEAKLYVSAYIDSLKDNKYAVNNRNKIVAKLQKSYSLSEIEADYLLKEMDYPTEFVPNYFE